MSDVDDVFDVCDICGADDCLCSKLSEPVGIISSGASATSHLDVTLPVGEDTDRVAEMLVERGYDPDEWEITNLRVNEWQSPRPKDRGVLLLRQTKATLTRIIPESEQPWGRLLEALRYEPPTPRTELRRLKPKKDRPNRILLVGDHQAPWVNWPLHETLCEALPTLDVDGVCYMGDGTDFDNISRWPVEHDEWSSTLQEGLDSMHRCLAEILDAAGNPAHAWYLEGNHEHRLTKHLLAKAPALFGLRRAGVPDDAASVLSLRSLLRLDDLGVEYATSDNGNYPHPYVELAPGFIAHHGRTATKGAGASVLKQLEGDIVSQAVGHTHRLAAVQKTVFVDNERRLLHAVETGTVADLEGLGYSVRPDWQGGFATADVWPDGKISIDLGRWDDDSLTWRDQRWTRTPRGIRHYG